MSPDQFLARIKKGVIAPAYLFLGTEAYGRDRCRKALVDAMLVPDEREAGLAQYDLRESALPDVVEDARSLSLFAPKRVILVANAEMALPRLKAGEEEDDDAEAPTAGGAQSLDEYLKDPTPGIVLLFEAVRFDFEGEEKKRLERVRKFYASVAETVELHRYNMDDAPLAAHDLAKRSSVQQIQRHFSRVGVPVWSSRAEQIYQTVGKFSKEQLELGLKLIFEADRDMRNTRPDDRIVMEKFIFALTR